VSLPSELADPAPTSAQRRQIEALVGYGFSEAEIATVLAMKPEALRMHCSAELAAGGIKANAKVAENLYRRATGEGREAVIAAIFWLKARANWCDTSVHEVSGRDGQPIRVEIGAVDANL
jgi:hypothetical protein